MDMLRLLLVRGSYSNVLPWLRCDNCGELFRGEPGEPHVEDVDGWACHGTGQTT